MKKIFSLILAVSILMSVFSSFGIYAEEASVINSWDFENGIEDGWTVYGVNNGLNVVKTNEDKYDGEYSIYILDDSDTTTNGITSPFIDVVPGEKYTFSAAINIISGTSIRLYVKFYDAKNSLLSNVSKSTLGNYWHYVYATYQAPENAVKACFQFVGTSTLKGSCYVDSATVYKGTKMFPKTEAPVVPPSQSEPVDASIVAPSGDELTYKTYNEEGDKLSDFSYAGFYGGDFELPETKDLPIVKEISPTGTEDDSLHIQNAIDEASAMEGDLKVVKLKAGKYWLPKFINIKSGVLLSGEGQGPEGTILYASKPAQYSPVHIEGSAPIEYSDSKYYLTDEYVKSGSRTVHVSERDIVGLSVGDEIAIYSISNDEWCEAMDMVGVINVYDNDTSWNAGEISMVTERKITAINGTEITLDFGFFVPYITEIVPAYIVKLKDTRRVENAGLENMRIESYFDPTITGSAGYVDENHATVAVTIKYAKNVFLRDITSKYFYFGLVQANRRTKQITVRNCSCLDPVSTIAGSRRYSFHASYSAQQVLYTGCYSYDARHDYATSREVTGPIAFVDNIADSSNTSSETHGTWSTGVLYDNIYQISNATKGFIANANRGIYGTEVSQGWTSGGCVIWNSLSPAIISHKPPLTYQNFVVGNWGTYTDKTAQDMKQADIEGYKSSYRTGSSTTYKEENFATSVNTSVVGDSYKESVTVPVNPRSLYKAQLAVRYTGSYKNARPNAPVLIYPTPDNLVDKNTINILGFFEKGASKVLVYIDNIAYEAELDLETNEFRMTKELSDGYHKIYATQVIDGHEGNKTADRFITINEGNGNPEYLQSIYSTEESTMLLNDNRFSFVEYMAFENVEFPEVNDAQLNNFYGEVAEGDYLKVKNQTGHIAITGNYSIVATRLPAFPGYKPVEYGMILSKSLDDFDLEDCDERVQSKIDLTNSYAYGILFYNVTKDTNYNVRSYAIYKDILEREHIMYGKVQKLINE